MMTTALELPPDCMSLPSPEVEKSVDVSQNHKIRSSAKSHITVKTLGRLLGKPTWAVAGDGVLRSQLSGGHFIIFYGASSMISTAQL